MNLVRKSRVNFQISASFYGNTVFCTSFLFWLQILHTNSDFYRLYITENGISRSTTSVLKIFPNSDPKQSRTSENSSSLWKLRELHIYHMCDWFIICLIQKNLVHIYKSALFILLFHQTKTQNSFLLRHQKTPFCLMIHRSSKQIFGWNQPKLWR